MRSWCPSWVTVREKWNTEASESTPSQEEELEEKVELVLVEVVLPQEPECDTILTETTTMSA